MSAERCPVCGGSGLVHSSLYQPSVWQHTSTAVVSTMVMCRGCAGCGVVWPPHQIFKISSGVVTTTYESDLIGEDKTV